MSKFAKGNNSKNKKKIKFSPGNLFIILYQLTKFEAPSCDSFWDIFITKLHYEPLEGT